MTIVYPGPGPWGPGKDSPLSKAEFGGNFFDHETRITDLETTPPQPNDIVGITLTGAFLSMTQRDGTILGPVPFAPPMARWRSEWTVSTAYIAYDFVTVTGVGLFGVLQDHTSDATTFDANAVNITDDLLYRKIVGYSGTTAALSDLVDATITSPANGDQIVYNGTSWINRRPRYIIGCASSGVMTSNQNLLHHRFTKAVTIPANFGAYLGHSSQAGGSATATGSTIITVAKAANATPTSFSSAGTITIASSSITPTFASSGSAAISFAQGDVLRLRGPSSADATLSDFFASLVGYET